MQWTDPAERGRAPWPDAYVTGWGIDYIDTGAMYRAVGYKLLKEGVSLENTEAVQGIAGSYGDRLFNRKIFLDGEGMSAV